MNVSTAQNITHYNYKTANKNISQSDMNFSDYISHHQNKTKETSPNASDERTLVEMSSFPYDKSNLTDIMQLANEEMLKRLAIAHAAVFENQNEIQYNEDRTAIIFEGREIPIADFSNARSLFEGYDSIFEYELDPKNWEVCFNSSDPEYELQNHLIRLSILKGQQYCDFTHAYEFYELTENQDFRGMSDSEKYTAILDKYKYCYGEDFQRAFAISYPYSGSRYDMMRREYFAELNAVFGNYENACKANREVQFGNMSEDEIRQAIIDKYPPMGEMTFQDLYFMLQDMSGVGVQHGVSRLIDDVFLFSSTYAFLGDGFTAKELLLDMPVDSKFINAVWEKCNMLIEHKIIKDPYFEGVAKQIFPKIVNGVNLGVTFSNLFSQVKNS